MQRLPWRQGCDHHPCVRSTDKRDSLEHPVHASILRVVVRSYILKDSHHQKMMIYSVQLIRLSAGKTYLLESASSNRPDLEIHTSNFTLCQQA